jgi:hypothetical protein
MIYFFNVGHTVCVAKVRDMRIYQNEYNKLLSLSIPLLQTSKTDNNALEIDGIYNLIYQTALLPN